MNKAILVWAFKALIAGLLALMSLCVFCLLYYNQPIHVTANNGMTDYLWTPNFSYSRLTEGFGFGKIDKNGYVNSREMASNDCDVLIMGSSHMEAINVFQNETSAFVLNSMLNNLNVYNIGTSGHDFMTCSANFKGAIDAKNPKYVIIETSTTTVRNDQIQLVLSDNLPIIPSADTGVLFHLQKIPYLRLLYSQYKGLQEPPPAGNDLETTPSLIGSLLTKIGTTANEHNTKLIVFYHPTLQLDEGKSVTHRTDSEDLLAFSTACAENGITFVDMTDIFLKEYETSYILPHGFFNSPLGTGHLNADGHRMIAEELARVILEMEDEE